MMEMVHTGDEIETLYEKFSRMLDEIKKGAQERDRYERQKKEMEFDILLSRSTLTISTMCSIPSSIWRRRRKRGRSSRSSAL